MPKKLWILDVDGTIVQSNTTKILPGVREWIATLDPNNNAFAFVTNQGVALLRWMELVGGFGKTEAEKAQSLIDAAEKYPTQDQVMDRLKTIRADLFGGRFQCVIFVCYRYKTKAGNWSRTPFDTTEAERVAWAYNEKDNNAKIEESEDDLPKSWRKDRRKPAPGMLYDAMDHYRGWYDYVTLIGNSDDDQGAASAADITYHDADEFFGRRSQ